MELKILIISVLLTFASSKPDPNVNVNVNLNVGVEDECNGCTLNCLYGNKLYHHEAYIQDACLVLQCIGGTWIYTTYTNSDCGSCEVYGDPHFIVFENHTMPKSNYVASPNSSYYDFQGNGSYVISQNGLHYPSLFGTNATFEDCGIEGGSCVTSAIYYEPGFDINVTLPSLSENCDPFNSKPCAFKVYVNGIEQQIGNTVELFTGAGGTVFVFKYNYENFFDHVTCINIVGTKGLSVSLCSYFWKYSFLNVWATPSLQSKESQLFGLCGTFTGTTQDGYTMQNGSKTNDIVEFAGSWKGEGSITPISSTASDKVGRCNTTFNEVIDSVQEQCISIFITYNSNTATEYEFGSFVLSCMYDLCRVPGLYRFQYAQGFAVDLAIRRHLKRSPCSPFPSCCSTNPSSCK